MREKIHFINLLKTICFVLIFIYHLVGEIQSRLGVWDTASGQMNDKMLSSSNIHFGILAVALFFLMSGMAQMISVGDVDSIRWGKYLKKKVVRILIPYWVVTIIFFGIFWHFRLPDEVPVWRLIFNVFGMDGILEIMQFRTFYIMVGEWFMGPLIIMYLLFPLLYKALKKHPRITLGIMMIVYFVRILFIQLDISPIFSSPTVKLCDFILGMHIAMVWKKIDRKVFFVALGVFAFYCFLPVTVPMPMGIRISGALISIIIICAYLEPWLSKFTRINRVFDITCKYSYEVFLVHHGVIIFVINWYITSARFYGHLKFLIILSIAATLLAAIVLHYLCKLIVHKK